jgi:protein phosphatase
MGNQETGDQDTAEFGQFADPRPHSFPSAEVEVELAAQSHQGHVRTNNEDHYLAVKIARSLETLLTNLGDTVLPKRSDETAYGILVADGMGDKAAGEIASSTALMRLLELAVQTPDWVMKMNLPENAATVMTRMTDRFRQIDDELRAQGESNQPLHGMGTTLTVSVSLGPDLFLSHIGDSRAYILRDGKLHQLTRDHTLTQALIETGIAGPNDVAMRAMRHVLTAALGTTGGPSNPQVQRFQLRDGDQLLLCTDGLSEMVTDDLIASVLADAMSAAAACQGLTDLALAAGGRDNITVVLARYHFRQPGRSKSSRPDKGIATTVE